MTPRKLKVLDLFSGIGGFSLGLERAKCEDGPYNGFETVAFCEIEDFPRSVLAKHWPDVPCYSDVRTLTAAQLVSDGIAGIDVITGGFPCQDVSSAGNLAGIAEEAIQNLLHLSQIVLDFSRYLRDEQFFLCLAGHFLQRRDAFVLVDALRRAVADGDNADGDGRTN